MFEHPQKCTLDAFDQSETNKIDFYTKLWSRNHINDKENIIHKQNLTMNITVTHNLVIQCKINFKIADLRPIV